MAAPGGATEAFVERVRNEREARGRPRELDARDVYRILDGLFADVDRKEAAA